MTLNEAFSKRVREILDERKITVYRLTQMTGIHPTTMDYIMNCRTKHSNFKTMAIIIRELGMSITEFFDSPVFNFENLEIDD
ncbi:MAG: helix-turn-helix transcriptional regulator [Clostridiales bacterium]|nr:helix-turn-helix transcriptional regulator [Clostridiales bacterium]